MKPVVELCSAKVVWEELQWGTVGWIELVIYSNAAQANCASVDTGAVQNTQIGYASCGQGPPLQDIAVWLKQINSYANVQIYKATVKSALDANVNLAMLHCPKCKVINIDIPNNVTNTKH